MYTLYTYVRAWRHLTADLGAWLGERENFSCEQALGDPPHLPLPLFFFSLSPGGAAQRLLEFSTLLYCVGC